MTVVGTGPRPAPAKATVLRGAKVIKRFSGKASGTFTLDAKRLARGEYRVRFESGALTTTLVSRKL